MIKSHKLVLTNTIQTQYNQHFERAQELQCQPLKLFTLERSE